MERKGKIRWGAVLTGAGALIINGAHALQDRPDKWGAVASAVLAIATAVQMFQKPAVRREGER